MKEWDLDAYQRKYAETLTIFKGEKGLRALYVNGITLDKDKKAKFDVSVDGDSKTIADDPQYFRFGGKWLMTTKGTHVAAVRRLKKSWKIGLCNDNFVLVTPGKMPNIKPWEVLPLSPLKLDIEAALKDQGPISEQLFLTPSGVYYLDKQVGLRKGTKFMVSEAVWQEVSDSLRGFKCSISV